VQINGTIIKTMGTIKVLGISMDTTLNWKNISTILSPMFNQK
jgi:hypothetical protein